MCSHYSRSKNIPEYLRTKIFVESSVPGRRREVEAVQQIDRLAQRIADANRDKNPRDFVQIVDAYKRTGGESSNVSDEGGHYQVEHGTGPKKGEPQIKEDPDTRLLREIRECGTIDNPIPTRYPQQDHVSPDPLQRMREEQTIAYSEPAKCRFCKREGEEVVFLESEERYSPVKDRMVSNIAPYPNNPPLWVPIDAFSTKRDRWGNYNGGGPMGTVVPHICRVESLGESDLRTFIREMVYIKLIELEKWV